MRRRAASAIAKDTKPVRVVDHHGGTVLLRKSADVWEVGDVSVNGEHAVHHHYRP